MYNSNKKNIEELDSLSVKIADWHKETFPKATLESQLLKEEEEIMEMDISISLMDGFKELVDVFIVASALYYRFGSHLGLHTLDIIKERVKYNTHFIDYVNEKMELNKKRNWKEVSEGYYHH